MNPPNHRAVVQMKDSGTSWLGDVPVHWTVLRFKHVASIANGQVDPRQDQYSRLPLVAPNHIESGTGRLLELVTAADQRAISGKYLFSESDVLYSKIRPALAKACFPQTVGLCSADMYPIRPRRRIHPGFLLYVLINSVFTQFAVLESERVAMPKINRESLKECALVVPSIAEQHRIVEEVRIATRVIDRTVQAISSQLRQLREYRQSLISAAVTGQIDIAAESPDEIPA